MKTHSIKDHFKHDLEKDTYICPNNQELPFQQEIKHYLENETKLYKIERRYWNYNACQDCPDKEKCYKGTQRQIT
ncbi:transposase [Methanobrevibacter acididurans]|uniref:transposase n=1 Tax=Methanobrevibacter acididurans TaxID=120963 RepID=UPI0038FCF179